MSWLVIDLETSIKSAYRRKASPFLKENWVVMYGECSKAEPKAVGIRHTGPEDRTAYARFAAQLRNPELKLVVGVNGKFDILYLMRDAEVRREWMAFVARGGVLFDLQLAEYMLDGQARGSHMLSLNDLAMRYDEDMKFDEVKALWEAGIDTPDIEPALLSRYLLGEDLPGGGYREGDIGLTRNIFVKIMGKVAKSGMSRTIMLNMGALACSIEMEFNGLKVDKELGLKIAAELEEELSAVTAELNGYIPKDIPFEFNWGSRFHLSALIFGGTLKYPRREYDLAAGGTTFYPPTAGEKKLYLYAQKDETHYLLEDGTTMECLWWEHCYHTEHGFADDEGKSRVEYKSGKNAGQYKTKKIKTNDYTKPKGRMAEDTYRLPGHTQPQKKWEGATPGVYSTASEVLEELTASTTIPFLKVLGRVTALRKDLGTYFITTDKDGVESGMLTLVNEQDGLVHHSINHTSTVTGRLSASNPNSQNVSRGDKSRAKELFVSRFQGGSIGQSDFSSLEVYCQAILTGCRQLILDLRAGVDMHCMRLSAVEDVPYEEVLRYCKGWKETAADGTVINHAPVKEWDYKRTGAKVFSFQRAYGAGNATVANATGMSLAAVEALVAAEQARYPEIDQYFERRGDEIERRAQPTSQFVQHPANPAVTCQLRISRLNTPDGKRYTYIAGPSPEFLLKRGQTVSFSPTERKNYEVQGLGGEWMKAAMWLAVRMYYTNNNFNNLSLLVNTVHDALYNDSDFSVRFEALALLHACMLEASTFMMWWFKWDIPLPVPSDTTWGASMMDENPCDFPGFDKKVEAYRVDIRRLCMGGFTPVYKE